MHALKSKSNILSPMIDYSKLSHNADPKSSESVDVRKLLKLNLQPPLSESIVAPSNRLTETDSSFFTKQVINRMPVHHMLTQKLKNKDLLPSELISEMDSQKSKEGSVFQKSRREPSKKNSIENSKKNSARDKPI